MNKRFFGETGLYKDGFQIERVRFAGHDAILVKARSAFNDKTQRRDYFYLNDGVAAQISFMLPETDWTKDEQLSLKRVTETFAKY